MKTNWWRSLQVKIIAWSFVPTVIILSAVSPLPHTESIAQYSPQSKMIKRLSR